ncbi:alcohol dehydrogenase family protein [Vibrio algivorus]|uniref:Alcohol dehydrogenase n=1 Tax=Vibrio algivorus TaxID=1667024 RepID=A0ABQ6EK57_9VIBR|nr:alcohol dehydrogenase family protein [Vibrio algivorus]GLT13389.1 alcohol dehydrogenase [Vibrio algivorus]
MKQDKTMKAVVTMEQGGLDKLVYQDVAIPELSDGEVLIKVLAAGVNNTEINTRMGWYSGDVNTSTNDMADQGDFNALKDGGWSKETPFPLIQGTDCCGIVVDTANDIHKNLIDQRVIVRSCMRTSGFYDFDNIWMASDFDGAFAEYVKVPASEVFPVQSQWNDEQLASIPCAYGTAENMLHRANVKESDTVLVMGASGGVGSAAVQLVKRRGATVFAVASKANHASVQTLGADKILDRNDNLIKALGENSVDVVIDNVAGENFGLQLTILKRGGRLATSGAIAGPVVNIDLRKLYLKDITLIGTTAWDEPVFPNLVQYIEKNEIKPLVAKTFPLKQIAQAQTEFLQKNHFGKFVLIP